MLGTAQRFDDGGTGGEDCCTRLACLAVALVLAASATAENLPVFAQILPQATAEEAFAEPYGKAVTTEMGRVLAVSGDPTCLAAGDLTADKLVKASEALLVKYGQRMIDRVRSHVDAKAAEAHFARLAGPSGLAELKALARDPLVIKLQDLQRPGALDRIVDLTAETFDRYVMLRRMALAGRVSPIAAGSKLKHASRADDSDAHVLDLVDAHKGSTPLRRYLELIAAAHDAYEAAINMGAHLKYGPLEDFAGADADLRALCIGERE